MSVSAIDRLSYRELAQPTMTTEQPDGDAPASSGLFRDIMATFGSPSFRMPCHPEEEDEEDGDAECDIAGDDDGG